MFCFTCVLSLYRYTYSVVPYCLFLNNSYCTLGCLNKETLENIEGEIKNGQSRETGNIEHAKRRKIKQKYNMGVGHRYAQTNTNNVNKT